MPARLRPIVLVVATCLLLIAPGSARAGPPCVCWPIDAGDAPVIDEWKPGVAAADVADALLASLDDDLPVLARMEDLRRAANALQGRPDVADRVLSRLMARVLDAETGKARAPALRWFDAGYAVACFRQAGILDDLRGYRWIARALTLTGADEGYRGGDGAMHFAAALAVLMPHPDHGMFGHHLRQLREAASKDPLLAENLEALEARYPAVLEYFEKR